ncbi:hypothetical protein B0T14DRAFT_571981 [Immersiella caudata]|uniref:DUF7924 domain-containing protein n=1 Tax=Immersiella caudata TaxID=314043 RepID=A0AA39TLY7_9PEZI|nr:hypothetical protein B0T14DRAFT_571981 [Immersiella caudata]
MATIQQLRRSARLAQRWDTDLDDIYSPGGHHVADDTDSLDDGDDNLVDDNLDDENLDDDNLDDDSPDEDDENMENVKHPSYRVNCLESNHIIFRHPQDPLPDVVATHVQHLASTTPKMPNLDPEMVAKATYDLDTLGMGCNETDISSYLNAHLFPQGAATRFPTQRLLSVAGTHMARHLLPNLPTSEAPWAVTQPRPDLLYGYPKTPTFSSAQSMTLIQGLHGQIPAYAQASPGLWFPFFTVEFKATAGTQGNLWVAANQCAGILAACIQAVNQLNTALQHVGCDRQHVSNLCYGLAIDNSLAQLYVSWGARGRGHHPVVYVQRVGSFLLSDAKDFARLYQWVMAILDWGQGGRLENIQLALDSIREEQQKAVSGAAQSQPSPEREAGLEKKRRRLK